jgi:hypothetical protein
LWTGFSDSETETWSVKRKAEQIVVDWQGWVFPARRIRLASSQPCFYRVGTAARFNNFPGFTIAIHSGDSYLLGTQIYMSEMSSSQPNPFLLAADNSPQLLPLLRENTSLASAQDEHGYSLMHAAASYNHLDLLRALVNELHVNVDLKDEDGETALFVAETMDCAKVLVEELHADISIRGDEGKTAREKIEEEGEFPEVAVYLRIKELEGSNPQVNGVNGTPELNGIHPPPPLPDGISVNLGTMDPEEDAGEVVDPEFRRRIEELAQREDFQGEEGQRQLRELITEAIRGEMGQQRDVRRRTD